MAISISGTIGTSGRGIRIKESERPNLYDLSARVSHNKTLDGDVHILSSGVVQGDGKQSYSCLHEESVWTALKSIFENETRVLVSCREGLFLAAPDKLKSDGQKITFSVLIESREVA